MKKLICLLFVLFVFGCAFAQYEDVYRFRKFTKNNHIQEFEISILNDSFATVVFYEYTTKIYDGVIKQDSLVYNSKPLDGKYFPMNNEIVVKNNSCLFKIFREDDELYYWTDLENNVFHIFDLVYYKREEIAPEMGSLHSEYY